MVELTFNPNTYETEAAGNLCEYGASLIYKLSSRTGSKLQKNSVFKNKNRNRQTTNETKNLDAMTVALFNVIHQRHLADAHSKHG